MTAVRFTSATSWPRSLTRVSGQGGGIRSPRPWPTPVAPSSTAVAATRRSPCGVGISRSSCCTASITSAGRLPDNGAIREIFGRLDLDAFDAAVARWVADVLPDLDPDSLRAVAIDGQPLRGSRHRSVPAVHLPDADRNRTGSSPQALAILRNLAVTWLRLGGVANIVAAPRRNADRGHELIDDLRRLKYWLTREARPSGLQRGPARITLTPKRGGNAGHFRGMKDAQNPDARGRRRRGS